MNTKLSYGYADASNYKQWGEVVFKGKFTVNDIKLVKENLDFGEFFIASQVDLEDIQRQGIGFPSEDDHVYCRLDDGFFELTDEEANDPRTINEFALQFSKVKSWNVFKAMDLLGIDSEVYY